MTDWRDFLSCERSLLIAPAGHGKTTAIAECLLQCPSDTCQLILTHTHAGLASLRTKLNLHHVSPKKYQLDTISGFAQRYVLSFLGSCSLPEESNKLYFSRVIERCTELMCSEVVQTIIMQSYAGVFVDEYQDCTIAQHNMIERLSKNLPLHILGDPLQGIFSFGSEELVDFDSNLSCYQKFETLTHPWRWHDINECLGETIYTIRTNLEKSLPISLSEINTKKSITICKISPNDDKFKTLASLIDSYTSESTLIIYPSYTDKFESGKSVLRGNLKDRITLKQRSDYKNQFLILDAIDSSTYYKCSKNIDKYVEDCQGEKEIKKISRLYDILKMLQINVVEINKWMDNKKNRLKNRRGANSKYSEILHKVMAKFEQQPNLINLYDVVNFIFKLPSIKSYHKILYDTTCRCFEISKTNNIRMYEAMKLYKNRLRHQGRKVQGRFIGTTLLTKGLEFDTVIIWDAHKFQDAKNFYVAISRACRKLIIMTETLTLHFN